MSHGCSSPQIRDGHHRIGWRFRVDHLGSRSDSCANMIHVAHVDVREGDARLLEDRIGQAEGPSVHVFGHDHMIATAQRAHDGVDRSQPGAEGVAGDTTFHGGNTGFPA